MTALVWVAIGALGALLTVAAVGTFSVLWFESRDEESDEE